MKRAWLALAVLAVLGLSSCDQMFESNYFAKLTHEELSAADMQTATPEEIETYLESDAYLQQISGNNELMAALNTNLTTVITTKEGDTAAPSPELQKAAVVQGQLLIKASPAADMSTSLLMELPDLMSAAGSGTFDVSAVVDSFTVALPPAIKDALSSGAGTPPQAFYEMIGAFEGAFDAYKALGEDIFDGGSTDYSIPMTDAERLDVAINAAISAFVANVQPVGPETLAEALWSALSNPSSAGTYISVSSTTLTDLFDPGAGDPAMYNLLNAAGISY